MSMIVVILCLSALAVFRPGLATTIFNNAIDTPLFGTGLRSPFLGWSTTNRQGLSSESALKRRCPICDSSVYGYCSEKLFHDSCCCHNPNNPYDQLPYQCQFADCSFLHANSCGEHKLITACCCTNFLLYRK